MFLNVYKLFKKLLTKSSKNSYLSKCFEINFLKAAQIHHFWYEWENAERSTENEWYSRWKVMGSRFSSISYFLIFFIFSRFWVNFCHFSLKFPWFCVDLSQFDKLWTIWQIMVNLTNYGQLDELWWIWQIFGQLENFLIFLLNLTHLGFIWHI